MEKRDYFTEEQLERQVSEARAEIRYIKQKMLIKQAGITAALLYLLYFLPELRFSGIGRLTVFTLNLCGWLLWIFLAGRRVVGGRRVEPPSMDFGDDYRRLSYYLSRLHYLDALFDLFIGLQFIFLVGLIALSPYFRI